MINADTTNRLIELAKEHLNCNLDDNPPKYIPNDLKPGTYRWLLYLYSNMYTEQQDEINKKDKLMFISVFKRLRDEHTISWTRDSLVELNKRRRFEIIKHILKNIRETHSFYELKASLYLYRNIHKNWYIADQFILQKIKGLEKLV